MPQPQRNADLVIDIALIVALSDVYAAGKIYKCIRGGLEQEHKAEHEKLPGGADEPAPCGGLYPARKEEQYYKPNDDGDDAQKDIT